MTASFYFDPDGTGSSVFLGPLEARLMDLVWDKGALTVKQALFYLGSDAGVAYTTVMTVLTRLTDKRLLGRVQEGRTFVYEPAVGKDEFLESKLKEIEECLSQNFGMRTRKT